MANSKTSLNGYEYGRNPKTTAPFWGGSGEGAQIDDTGTYTDKTWSSKKISDELAEKADTSELANYAKATAVYTKTQTYTKEEVNDLLENIPSVDAYTKTETNNLLASKANAADVYTKTQTYTKTEVNNLISEIPAVDAYTKTQTDNLLANKANVSDVYTKTETNSLLAGKAGVNSVYTKGQTDRLLTDKANAADVYTKTQTDGLLADKADVTDLADYAKATSVYTKSQTYTKTEVDNLISGVTPTPVDAYTKAQTDALLDEKADAASVYTKTQTDNLLADKANSSDVYTKTQTDNLLADKANSSNVYSKSQTYTKTEVDNLISQAGGGGAEIDDTTVAANKVWSSNKTRAELLKASGLRYTSYISTDVSLIRAKIAGSNSNTQNAMTEPFSADYQYSLSGATLTVTIMYADGSAGQTATINLTDIPWNELASAEYTTNYPDDNARWKRIVASEDIFEVCIAGNVSGTSGYYYPYIFVRVPKGTYTASISLSTNLKYVKWTKAGSVSVINGYANDSTAPLFTYDATSDVTNSTPALNILYNAVVALVENFKRDTASVHKINKIVIETVETISGYHNEYKDVFNVTHIDTQLITTSLQATSNMKLSLVAVNDKGGTLEWKFNLNSTSNLLSYLYKINLSIPSTSGAVTGSMIEDNTASLPLVATGGENSRNSWKISFYS